LQYVELLVELGILVGDAAVEAYGWAEERREELELVNQEREATSPGNDELMLKKMSSLADLLTEAVGLLKIVLALLALLCVMVIQKK
jgi:hypothetical protein